MKNLALALLLLAQHSILCAVSDTLKGNVQLAESPAQFATIGFPGLGFGTISDEFGDFELVIPNNINAEDLTISFVGYHTALLKLDSVRKVDWIKLTMNPKIHSLNEVVVSGKRNKGKLKTFGAKRQHKVFWHVKSPEKKGAEIARLFSPKSEFLIKKIRVNIMNRESKDFLLLLNLYSKSDSNLPDDQLLQQQKVIRSNQSNGWLEIDISNQNISLDQPFFVSFQWVRNEDSIPSIGTGSQYSSETLLRTKTLGNWIRFAGWDIQIEGVSYKN